MKKLVIVVIWVFAILVGGIYMSFPSSRVVRDAAKVEKTQKDSSQKEYLLYLPDGSFEKRRLEEKESKSEELHGLVQAELDYLHERDWEKERITLHNIRSEEHTSELQTRQYLVCRLLLEKKKITPLTL